MPVLVEEVMQAKSGKSLRVRLGGKFYGASLDSGLADKRGQFIEAEIQTSDKYGPWIKKWVLSNAAPQAAAIPPAVATPPQSQPAAAAPAYDERNPPPDMEGPRYAQPSSIAEQHFREAAIFMSGAVNHAIGAGKVGSPVEVRAWASASLAAFYDALEDLRKLRE